MRCCSANSDLAEIGDWAAVTSGCDGVGYYWCSPKLMDWIGLLANLLCVSQAARPAIRPSQQIAHQGSGL